MVRGKGDNKGKKGLEVRKSYSLFDKINGPKFIALGLFLITFIIGSIYLMTSSLYSESPNLPGDAEICETVDISGTVHSTLNGEVVVPQATVEVIGTDINVKTNSEGFYHIEELPKNRYDIKVSKDGYGYHSKRVNIPSEGSTIILDFQLGNGNRKDDVRVDSNEQNDENELNKAAILVIFGCACAAATVIIIRFTNLFYLPFLTGILSMLSFGFFFGSLCAVIGSIMLVYSKKRI